MLQRRALLRLLLHLQPRLPLLRQMQAATAAAAAVVEVRCQQQCCFVQRWRLKLEKPCGKLTLR
jgi:hypothetical protein